MRCLGHRADIKQSFQNLYLSSDILLGYISGVCMYIYIYRFVVYLQKHFWIFVYIRILGMMKVVRGFYQKLKMFCPFYFGLLLAPVDQPDIM